MEGHCSTGQSPQWAVVRMEEEEEEYCVKNIILISLNSLIYCVTVNYISLRHIAYGN